jgi:hypothetical protein
MTTFPHFLIWSNHRERQIGPAGVYTLIRSTIHAWRKCVTLKGPFTPLTSKRWIDGREVLYVEGSEINMSRDGIATVNNLSAEIYE